MVTLTRGVPAPMMAALAETFYPVVFVWLDWPGAPLRAHSGVGTITWGGHSWAGVGKFGAVSVPSEDGGSMVATEASLSLVADPAALDGYLDDAIRNLSGEIYKGLVTARPGEAGGTTLVSDPVTMFSGTMDGLLMDITPDDAGYTTQAVVSLVTGPGARSGATIYHSGEDQARRYPGDTAGRLVALAIARLQKMTWPEA